MRHAARLSAAWLALACATGLPALAQEPAPEPAAPSASAPEGEAPKPRPKRRPPAPRPAKPSPPKPTDPAAEGLPATASPAEGGTAGAGQDRSQGEPAPKPASRPRAPKPAAAKVPSPPPAPAPAPEAPPAAAPTPAALSPPPTVAAEPPTACGARAALYDGAKGFSAHVTKLGRVEVENPLRPLTPEVTQVLQLIIGAKVATAYGPDLTALRRGSAPAVLESQLGGGIRWEPSLPLLPETLTIVSEAGEPLARLGFRACTEAPPADARAKDKTGARRPAAKAAPKAPPGFNLPQGAISQ